jgi:polysaccharide pyruvyl transferase WcaK-like protein
MAKRFLQEMGQCDALVYNGEASLYRNTMEGKRSLFLLWLCKTRLGKPACIVNQTAHLNNVRPIMNAMVRKVYPALDLVTCRESASHRLLREMGIANAELIPDVVFWLQEEPEAKERVENWLEVQGLRPGTYVCMSTSALPVSRPRGGWDGAYAALVREVRERTGLRPLLIARDPHCQFLKDVARRTGSACIGSEHHFSSLWPLLRNAAGLVTGHFHYCIAAAIVGCPFVPMTSNNHKMAGLTEMLGWQPVDPFDVTDLAECGGAITDRLVELLRNRADYSAHLAGRSAHLRTQVQGLPDRVVKIITAGR